MLDNHAISSCQACYDQESNKQISQRQICIKEMQRYSDLLESQINDHHLGKELVPYWYDIRYSNNCNLTCRMCSPDNSSSIAKEMGLFQPYMVFEPDIQINPKSVLFYMAGGEPFLIKKFAKALASIENVDCEIMVNTNATITNKTFIAALSRFTNVCMIVSLDGYGDINEKIRTGSKWQDIDNNIDLFLSKGWSICAATVIQKDNINHLMELASYLQEKGIEKWICTELYDKPDLHWTNIDVDVSSISKLISIPLINRDLKNTQLFAKILKHANC